MTAEVPDFHMFQKTMQIKTAQYLCESVHKWYYTETDKKQLREGIQRKSRRKQNPGICPRVSLSAAQTEMHRSKLLQDQQPEPANIFSYNTHTHTD